MALKNPEFNSTFTYRPVHHGPAQDVKMKAREPGTGQSVRTRPPKHEARGTYEPHLLLEPQQDHR